jgi:hypothetical protein
LTRFNTAASYILRLLVAVHLINLAVLSESPVVNPSSAAHAATALTILFGVVCVLIAVDWTTPKNPSRKYSKLIDSVIAIVFFLSMGALVLYSLSMGTL